METYRVQVFQVKERKQAIVGDIEFKDKAFYYDEEDRILSSIVNSPVWIGAKGIGKLTLTDGIEFIKALPFAYSGAYLRCVEI